MTKMASKKQKMDLLDNKVMGALGMRVDAGTVSGLKERLSGFLQKGLENDAWKDAEFMDDVRQATLQGARPAAVVFFWAMIAILVMAFIWSNVARLDEVSRGEGTVVPSGKVQTVGSTDGGVVAQIYVSAGDIVNPGQPLVRLDDTVAVAGVGEKEARRFYLQANIAQLQAQLENKALVFPPELLEKAAPIAEAARAQFASKQAEIDSNVGVLRERVAQRRQELSDARNKAESLASGYKLAKEELDMTRPYFDQGAISRADLLRLERQAIEAQKELTTARLAVPSASAALREADNALDEGMLKFSNEARQQLAEAQDELARLGESSRADVSRAERSLLKSPIRAEVKQVMVNTVGQAVQPGTNIVELVPIDETLLVEARLKPQDVAFVRPGMAANVKLTAYDYSIYGGLHGKVESLSPDSFNEKVGDKQESFYKVQVRTDKNYLVHGGQKLPIRSGMIATVDILTGKKTVMQYLLKPINKARQSALTER